MIGTIYNPTDWNILVIRINDAIPPIRKVSKKKDKRIGRIKRTYKAVLVPPNNEHGPPKLRKLTLTLETISIIIRNIRTKRTIEETETGSTKRIRAQESHL